MKENADKYLDELSRKVMGKSTLESPSLDFTKTVMSQIHNLSTSTITAYRPLISKPVWSFIALGVIAIFVYVIFGNPTASDTKWLESLNLQKFSLDVLPDYSPSQTLVYTVLLFTVMLCIQIPLLKHYFNKRIKA